YEGAIAEFKKAIGLVPKYADAHYNLGLALGTKGDPDGAIAAFKKAIALDPKHAQAHTDLGLALRAKGDPDGALAPSKKAMAIDPKYAQAHGALGQALLGKGSFAEARTATRECLQRLPPAHLLRNVVTQQLRLCEQWLQLDAKLPAILKGDAQPGNATEQ